MIIRGFLTAGIFVAGAFASLSLSEGNAGVSPEKQSAERGVALAPMSLGNPQAAGTLSPYLALGRHDGGDDELRESAGKEPITYSSQLKVKKGDTLASVISRAGASADEATSLIKSLSGVFDPRGLKVGQEVYAKYIHSFPTEGPAEGRNETVAGNSPDRFAGLSIPIDYQTVIDVSLDSSSEEISFTAEKKQLSLSRGMVRVEGKVQSSLYIAARKQGVSPAVISELIRAFSWDVDFQRDIWKGDGFEVLFSRYYDDRGNTVNEDGIIYAALTIRGVKKSIYLHRLADGTTDYFDENGQSARKALMRTPIDGARLSSSFGKRKHPILGYTKVHKGADFAAPSGTPIYAAGDGAVDVAGWKGAYGRYIRIRHNSDYSTAYAHMKSFAKGIGRGKRVRQGQVIGYVGSTGRSTGPHLHYEILKGGKQVNPMQVKMPSGIKLKGNEMVGFKKTRAEADRQWASLRPQSDQLAER